MRTVKQGTTLRNTGRQEDVHIHIHAHIPQRGPSQVYMSCFSVATRNSHLTLLAFYDFGEDTSCQAINHVTSAGNYSFTCDTLRLMQQNMCCLGCSHTLQAVTHFFHFLKAASTSDNVKAFMFYRTRLLQCPPPHGHLEVNLWDW